MLAHDYFGVLVNRGIDSGLCARVHEGLYKKRQGLDEVPIDLDRMAEYYGASKDDLKAIIAWYESNLISTKFVLI